MAAFGLPSLLSLNPSSVLDQAISCEQNSSGTAMGPCSELVCLPNLLSQPLLPNAIQVRAEGILIAGLILSLRLGSCDVERFFPQELLDMVVSHQRWASIALGKRVSIAVILYNQHISN